ncbi:MAG: AI-2E family transporter, partial [Alistipes sp.]|nr:AI-2E family transporter [Alistipes sp.]
MSSKSNIGRWLAGLAAVGVVAALLWYFRSTVVYILISAVVAIIGRPLVRIISNINIGKYNLPRWVAALFTLVVMWAVIISFCLLVVPLIVGKITSLAQLDLSSTLATIQAPIGAVQDYLSSISLISDQSVSVSEILM